MEEEIRDQTTDGAATVGVQARNVHQVLKWETVGAADHPNLKNSELKEKDKINNYKNMVITIDISIRAFN